MLFKRQQKTAPSPTNTSADTTLRSIMEQWSQPVYWHVRRLVGTHADAEDVVQETFIKVYRSLSTLRDSSALKAWIYKIATNEALSHLRHNQADHVSIDDAAPDLLALKADDYFDYTDLEAVKLQNAINALPPKQRLAFNLRYYDEMSYDDIADVTESTPGNVKVNYHIAKTKIIEYMNRHD